MGCGGKLHYLLDDGDDGDGGGGSGAYDYTVMTYCLTRVMWCIGQGLLQLDQTCSSWGGFPSAGDQDFIQCYVLYACDKDKFK